MQAVTHRYPPHADSAWQSVPSEIRSRMFVIRGSRWSGPLRISGLPDTPNVRGRSEVAQMAQPGVIRTERCRISAGGRARPTQSRRRRISGGERGSARE